VLHLSSMHLFNHHLTLLPSPPRAFMVNISRYWLF
jgi:hypothetical protein